MMTRSDWEAVRDSMMAGDRTSLGAPPTADELLAYERGELSAEEAERVQQLLVAYPELARAFAMPFPSEDEAIDEVMVERQWRAFRAANFRHAADTRALPLWRAAAAVAAAIAIVFGAMLWRTRAELLRPRVLPDAVVLTPDGVRSPSAETHFTVTPRGEAVVLVVSIIGPLDYDTYRLELVRRDSHERLWSSAPMRAPNSNSFNVEVLSRALRPGTYQVIAYGVRGVAQEPVATYTIDVR